MKPIQHFKTITQHRRLVREGCFAVGLYRQGIMHDLSKYSPAEFWVGARFYQGTRSPNNAEREKRGYSSAWLHHKGRNKHHYEYWIDYSSRLSEPGLCGMLPAPMPVKYIVEMLMDRIAACKVYLKDDYSISAPLEYYSKGMEPAPLHPKTKALLEMLLLMLSVRGEERTFAYVKKELLPKKHKFDKAKNLEHTLEYCKKITTRLESEKK